MDTASGSAAQRGDTVVTRPAAITSVHELYELHYVRLVRMAVLLVGDVGRAEEIVQDAFVDLVARWSTIREPGAAASYLRTCVANGARSHFRHRAVVNRQAVSQPSAVHSAESEALVQIEHERVLAVLARLPDRQREVVILRYYGQLSEAEIARALGISKGAVKTHSSRGLRSLRSVMELTP